MNTEIPGQYGRTDGIHCDRVLVDVSSKDLQERIYKVSQSNIVRTQF